jgi:hypothetical protein
LVASGAGTFYIKGKADVAEPEVTRSPAATADEGERLPPAADPAPDEGLGRGDFDDNSTEADQVTKTPVTAVQEEEADNRQAESRRADLLEAKRTEAARDLLQKSEAKKNQERSKRRRGKLSPFDAEKTVIARPEPKPETNAVSGTDPLQGYKPDQPAKAAKGKKKPGESGFAGDGAAESRPYRAYRDRPDGWVSEQQLRITEAYQRKDCLTAAKIANDILDRSPDLYTKSTTKLEGVKRCKAYVAKEARKRQVARQKNAKSGGKAAGKAKRAAQPAPVSDTESLK